MIEVKDRIPKKPNRILITPENGTAPFYATWQRADEPIEEGTPINKVLFDSIEEGGFSFTGVDDIEIEAQKLQRCQWTINSTVVLRFENFHSDRKLHCCHTEYHENQLRCSYSISTLSAYLATTSGGSPKTQANVFTGYSFVSVPVDILIVYDGGITP